MKVFKFISSSFVIVNAYFIIVNDSVWLSLFAYVDSIDVPGNVYRTYTLPGT